MRGKMLIRHNGLRNARIRREGLKNARIRREGLKNAMGSAVARSIDRCEHRVARATYAVARARQDGSAW